MSSSDFPEAAKHLPRVGSGITLNNEHLINLNPDVVIAWQPSQASLTLTPSLGTLEIELLFSQPKRLAEIPSEVRRFGHLFGTEAIANAKAEAMDRRIQRLSQSHQDAQPVSVFLEVGSNPIYTIGNDALFNDVLAVCGAVNVYGSSQVAAPQVNAEDLLQKNPALVFTTLDNPKAQSERLAYWQRLQLPAALNQHFHAIDPDALYRPGPRLVDAAEHICELVDAFRVARP